MTVVAGALPDSPKHSSTSHLCFLAEGLHLRQGPIPVTLETWSDGTVYAHLYDALLFGQGSDAAEALAELREVLEREYRHLATVQHSHSLGAPALRTWRVLSSLIEELPRQAGEAAE